MPCCPHLVISVTDWDLCNATSLSSQGLHCHLHIILYRCQRTHFSTKCFGGAYPEIECVIRWCCGTGAVHTNFEKAWFDIGKWSCTVNAVLMLSGTWLLLTVLCSSECSVHLPIPGLCQWLAYKPPPRATVRCYILGLPLWRFGIQLFSDGRAKGSVWQQKWAVAMCMCILWAVTMCMCIL